jgi:hypothetical protein
VIGTIFRVSEWLPVVATSTFGESAGLARATGALTRSRDHALAVAIATLRLGTLSIDPHGRSELYWQKGSPARDK